MSSEPEAFIAEFDESASQSPSPSASDEFWGVHMEIDIEAEIAKRRSAVRQVLSQTNPDRIKAGINAYKRDLPTLLHDHKYRYVVAYDGSTRVGIAPTWESLMLGLKQKGIDKNNNLFIKHVASLDDDSEHFHSSHTI